jgi:hypothetical protein
MRKIIKMERMNKMINLQYISFTNGVPLNNITLKLSKINDSACKSSFHCDEGKSSGESSSAWGDGDGGELKSKLGKTPGGLSRGSIDSNWLESPTTSAHP